MPKGLDVKKSIELTIIALGVIIFIFLIISYIPKPRDNKTVSGNEPYSGSEMVTAASPKTQFWDSVKWDKDPFLLDTSNMKERGMEDMTLNSIVSDKENPYAIINNDVVKLGDKVNDMTIIEINEKSVVLEQDGQKHVLELSAY